VALLALTSSAAIRAEDGGSAATPETASPVAASAAGPLDALLATLARAITCEGDAPLPETLTPALHEAHCRAYQRLVAYYRKHWLETASPFLASVVPADVSPHIIYPFGGGDLISALATFPRATSVTSLSLEPAGDVRRIVTLDAAGWESALADLRLNLQHLFAVSHSKTVNLRKQARAALPAEIAFTLVALSIHGLAPVGMHYVALSPDGSLVARDAREDPCTHVEITFRAPGGGPLRTYRHLAANLENGALRSSPALMTFLERQGRVTALVKAASYLLWSPAFSYVRSFLLTHADWMISDSTGVPPSVATAAGFTQEVWGAFHGTFFPTQTARREEMVRLWAAAPLRPLPIMFGYPDDDGHAHLMVTRRVGDGPSPEHARTPWDEPAGGSHWRLDTPRGPVHVWHPRGLALPSAGLVVYVHGLYTKVDEAFASHQLAQQFAASRLNAVFVAPEAPVASTDAVVWPSLAELRAEVGDALPALKTGGPTVLAGHSGAYRTIAGWLDDPSVRSLVLLDAMYGQTERYAAWVKAQSAPGPHLTLVTQDTKRLADELLASFPQAVHLEGVPARFADLSAVAREASVLELRTSVGHMQIVTSGRILPVVLRRTPVELVSSP